MAIKHKKTSTKPDNGDAGEIQPFDWNDDHAVDGLVGVLLGLGLRGNAFPYLDGASTAQLADLTAFARTLLAIANAPALLAALAAAPLDSPNLTGTPTAPTPILGTATPQIATMAALQAMRDDLINAAPGSLDTLKELATALGNDANFATTTAAALGNRLRVDAAQSLTSPQKAQAIANLALGTAATLDVGIIANKILQLDGSGKIPAVDGSQLTNVSPTGSLIISGAQVLTTAQQAQGRTNVGVDTATSAKSANYTVIATDYGSLIKLSGTNTLAFTAAATLGDKFKVFLRNTGTGIWTLDPNSTEQINGGTTEVLLPGESCEVFCDGSAFWTVGLTTGDALMATAVASASATIDFSNIFNARFASYRLTLSGIAPATNGVFLGLRGSIAGAWQANTSDYDTRILRFTDAASAPNGDTATLGYISINAGGGQSNVAGSVIAPMDVEMRIHNMDGASPPRFLWQATWYDGAVISSVGSGEYRAATALDGIRLFYTSGNIASGTVRLYGVRK